MATLYWEIGNQLHAEEQEEKLSHEIIRQVANYPSRVPPMAQSKLIHTLDCKIEGLKCHLSFYAKKSWRLKMETFYVETQFNIYTNDDPDPLFYKVETKRFVISSSDILPVNCKKWIKVVVGIFADDARQKKMGEHHQLLWINTETK